MSSKSHNRLYQTMKSSRVRYAAIFAVLVLVLVFSAVQANGPMRPPQPPRPPQQGGMWGMPMPQWQPRPPCHPWMPWKPWMPWMYTGPVPTMKIVAVLEDLVVLVETKDFPENQEFTVTMGEIYTRGIDGIELGTFNSGAGGSFYLIAFIPKELYGEERIAIRAQTDHDYPYYAFNWFWNRDYIPDDYAIDADMSFEALTAEAKAELTVIGVEPVPEVEAPAEPEAAPAAPEEEAGAGGAEEEAAEAIPAEPGLTGVTWQWTEFSDPVQGALTIEEPEQYNVVFMEEGLLGVKADCNTGNGTYIVDDAGGIDIAIGAVTLAMCAPESLSDQFLQYLNEVSIYSFTEDGNLLLDLPADSGTLRFAAAVEAAGEAEAPAEGEAEAPAEGEAESATVTGTVTYVQRIALPDDAVITVQIINASLADAPAEVLGEQVIETAGQQVPIPFEVAYNPDDINENLIYSVSARIEDGEGNLLFISDTATPVITNDSPTEDVEIMTVQVESSPEAEAPAEGEAEEGTTLTGFVWNWTQFSDPVQGTLEIEAPDLYSVAFLEDGTVGIKADCNNGSGSYVADEDGNIDITVGAVTLAMCDEDSLSDQFIQYLDVATIYFFDSGDLYMDLPADSGTLSFVAAEPEAEAGATAKLAALAQTAALGGNNDENGENGEDTPVPSFKICTVVRDDTVTVVTDNFPADQEFAVKMGVLPGIPMNPHPMPPMNHPPKPMPYQGAPMKSMGPPMGHSGGMWMKPVQKVWIPYYEAGTLETRDGGQLEATFDIPSGVAGAYKISIMMRTAHQYPYMSYNWFYNNDAEVCNGEVNGNED